MVEHIQEVRGFHPQGGGRFGQLLLVVTDELLHFVGIAFHRVDN